jgi:hypothetical protein
MALLNLKRIWKYPDGIPGYEGPSTMVSLMPLVLSSGTFAGLPWTWAYLDPGTGSMLFQVLIAGLLSALFCARSSYLNLRNALLKHHNKV